MLTVLAASAAVQTPNPTRSTDPGPNPASVTPGTVGFLFTLIIAVAGILLVRDALRRIRRVRARAGVEYTYPIPMRGKDAVPNRSDLEGQDTRTGEAAAADGDTPGDAVAGAGPGAAESPGTTDERDDPGDTGGGAGTEHDADGNPSDR